MNADTFPAWLQVALPLAPSISAIVAVTAFLFQVVNGLRVSRRESTRRDWERLQSLTQVLHNHEGKAGGWAQRLAIQELAELTTKKTAALLLAREALSYWEDPSHAGHDWLKAELRGLIEKLSR